MSLHNHSKCFQKKKMFEMFYDLKETFSIAINFLYGADVDNDEDLIIQNTF